MRTATANRYCQIVICTAFAAILFSIAAWIGAWAYAAFYPVRWSWMTNSYVAEKP